MKKILLTLAAAATLATASAATVTVTIAGADEKFVAGTTAGDLDKESDFTFTNSGFSFTTTKGKSTATAFNKAGDLRIYAGGTLTITGLDGKTIDGVVFNISAQGMKRLAKIDANVGTVAVQAVGDKTVTWTGDASSVTFTVGGTADYGSESGKAGQLDFDSIVITYTEPATGKESAGLAYPETSYTVEFGQPFATPVLANPNDLHVTYTSSNTEVASVAADGTVIIGAVGTTTIKATSEETEKYYEGHASYTLHVVAPAKKFEKVTDLISGGEYLFVVDMDGTLKYGEPLGASANYGRLSLTDAVMNGSFIEENGDNTFKFTSAEGGVTIQDADGRYYAMDDNHFTSFQLYSELNEGCYWDYEFNADGTIKLTNKLNTTSYVGVTKGGQGTWYTNIAPAKEPAEILYPSLYKEANSTAVAAIESEQGEAQFFNLQGVRVANPEKGLYIRIQNGKATKVLVK